ncbi:MAG: hypothetical protein WAP98_03175 [Caldicoprobacterales bacterium]|jgi:hypothetical protein
MNKSKRNKIILVGISTFAIVFTLFYFGIKIFLKINISGPNIRSYLIAALLTSLASVLFFCFRQKLSFYLYLSSLTIGFILMFIKFVNGTEDLFDRMGVMYFFISAIAGFLLALLIQLAAKLLKAKDKKQVQA